MSGHGDQMSGDPAAVRLGPPGGVQVSRLAHHFGAENPVRVSVGAGDLVAGVVGDT